MAQHPYQVVTQVAADDDGTLPDLGETSIARLIAQPGFDEAMRRAIAATIDLYDGNWMLNRIANDRGRMVLGLMILDLDFRADPCGGFTAAQLLAEATRYRVCSRGRLIAFLASLRVARFLDSVADEDRRLRRLVPTERFRALHCARWQRHGEALVLLDPLVGACIPFLAQRAVLGALAHALLAPFRRGIRVLDFVPALQTPAERDAGLTVLFALLLGEMTGEPVTIAALARRFSVSRAHVLTILRESQSAGLTIATSDRGGYQGGAALAPALRRFCAIMFLHQLHALRRVAVHAHG